MDTYGGQCGSCVHLNIEDHVGSSDRCRCTERGFYVSVHDNKCYRYKYDEYRDYRYMNRRWYIVTEICNKLGLTLESKYVSELFTFRGDVLENDPKYQDFLKEYDVLGPFLASLLSSDDDSLILCKNLFKLYLSKVACLIIDKKYDEALEAYITMMKTIESIYGIEIEKQNASTLIKVNPVGR